MDKFKVEGFTSDGFMIDETAEDYEEAYLICMDAGLNPRESMSELKSKQEDN